MSVACTAATSVYCTEDLVCYMRSKNFASQRVIHLTLFEFLAIGEQCAKVRMLCRGGVGTTICIAQFIGDSRTSNQWWTVWVAVLSLLFCSVIVQLYASLASLHVNLSTFGLVRKVAGLYDVSEGVSVASRKAIAFFIALTSYVNALVSFVVFVSKCRSSSLSGVV